MKTAVREQVNRLDGATYFKMMASLMKDNPPAKADAPIVAKMAKIGIVPGKEFDPAMAVALKDVPKLAQEKIIGHFKNAGVEKNGWVFTTKAGV
jgi:hypothetical protein